MPDESCRTCGGELVTLSLCSECRKVTQKKCRLCANVTREQVHDGCIKVEPLTNSGSSQVLELVHESETRKSHGRFRSYALIVGIVGFFVLGIATAAYFDIFHTPSSDVIVDSNLISLPQMVQPSVISQKSFVNCLAYGSGESVTVACPTDYGPAYKAILYIPKELSEKFSEAVFSIRGVSVIDNSDGSVILRYQNNDYKTYSFAR